MPLKTAWSLSLSLSLCKRNLILDYVWQVTRRYGELEAYLDHDRTIVASNGSDDIIFAGVVGVSNHVDIVESMEERRKRVICLTDGRDLAWVEIIARNYIATAWLLLSPVTGI